MSNPNNAPLSESEVIALVERELLAAAQRIGVPVEWKEGCFATAYDHLHLHATNTQVAGQEGRMVIAVVEVEVVLREPGGFGGVIHHLANGMGTTLNEAIRNVCNTLILDLLPPLCRLFGAEHGPQQPAFKVTSYTDGENQTIQWEGLLGPVQVWGDEKLYAAAEETPPVSLIMNTLTGYMAHKRLHWFKIFGVRHPNGETEFTVAVDNEVDPNGCAEAQHRFDWSPFPAPCHFRQFFVLRPIGAGDVTPDNLLEEARQAGALNPPPPSPKKKWFQFGRKH